MYTWFRKCPPTIPSYEVSSKGDKRFSALNAVMPDGRTIEQHYQCDVKGYDPGGTNWRLGEGKPPLSEMSEDDLYREYLTLWMIWSKDNLHLLRELYQLTKHSPVLTDCFATTIVNQAHALSDVLNFLIKQSSTDSVK